MLYRFVQLTLIGNSTDGNPPKTLRGQTVEISHKPSIVKASTDGITSTAHQPSTIVWHEGKARHLTPITNVRIVGRNGDVLIEGWKIITNSGHAPSDGANGVKFFVLPVQ
jgi:hypothetical protein